MDNSLCQLLESALRWPRLFQLKIVPDKDGKLSLYMGLNEMLWSSIYKIRSCGMAADLDIFSTVELYDIFQLTEVDLS